MWNLKYQNITEMDHCITYYEFNQSFYRNLFLGSKVIHVLVEVNLQN
jgi:hypothetical protein